MSARSRPITAHVVGFAVGGAAAFLLEMWWDDADWQHAAIFALFVMGFSTIANLIYVAWHATGSDRASGRL